MSKRSEDPTVFIKVLFFAKAKDIVGKKEELVQLSSNRTYEEILDTITSSFNLVPIKNSIVLAKNGTLLDSDNKNAIELNERDEIAVIPPLSGG